MILLEIYRPNPVPPISDFEANFVNNLGKISESIPGPASFTETTTIFLLPSFFCSEVMMTLPSYLVNLIELLRRLETA